VRYSQLFGKTLRQVPKEAETISHQLLTRAGYIDQLASGIYSFLPLGWRVHRKIENIIREEVNAIGGQEVFLPTLQPKSLWERTDRWGQMDPPLFKLKDRHHRELALGSTHEEVITDLAARYVESYKDLPRYLYQIQNKFRNEMRSTGGLLRVREFVMKDLYSFHTDEKDLAVYFKKVIEAYHKIFKRCGLKAVACQALGGSIGGSETYEFQVLASAGEDKVSLCEKCGWAASEELTVVRGAGLATLAQGPSAPRELGAAPPERSLSPNPRPTGTPIGTKCPQCGGKLEVSSSIENGHIFKLGTKYSEPLGAYFVDRDGQKKPIWMGCYGIGIGRLMATVVEAHHDDKGIIWPPAVAPYAVHLISIDSSATETAEKLYGSLEKSGVDILFDDRDESAGVKLKDADLIGVPVRVVVSKRSMAAGGVEISRRDRQSSQMIGVDQLAERIAEVYDER